METVTKNDVVEALHQVEIVMDQGRGFSLLGLLADVHPEVIKELHVGTQILFRFALAGRAKNESAGNADAIGLQDPLQPQPLVVGRDLAGYTDVIDSRHIDHEASGQRDRKYAQGHRAQGLSAAKTASPEVPKAPSRRRRVA